MEILKKAQQIVEGPRRKSYGDPKKNMSRVASLWTAYLSGRSEIRPQDVAMMMVLFKVSREANAPNYDNLVDIAGYTAIAEECLYGPAE